MFDLKLENKTAKFCTITLSPMKANLLWEPLPKPAPKSNSHTNNHIHKEESVSLSKIILITLFFPQKSITDASKVNTCANTCLHTNMLTHTHIHMHTHTFTECIGYHEQVVEQEDFSLVDAAPLSSVWIWNLKQLTAAHQPAMRQGQHLQRTHTHYFTKHGWKDGWMDRQVSRLVDRSLAAAFSPQMLVLVYLISIRQLAVSYSVMGLTDVCGTAVL